MLDSNKLKASALACGADLVGIAPIDRFDRLPAEAHPKFIKPDARSVIVLAFRIPRGGLRGPEAGSCWTTMGVAMSVAIDSTYLLCRELESDGWEAVPLFYQTADLRHRGVRVHPDKPEPDVIVDLDYAAHAAGLGEFGQGKFFLTPEFGPRQFFTAVVTDAEFTADPIFTGTICDGCGDCIRACPARAYADRFDEAALCEGSARWHALHLESCRVCPTGPITRPYCPQGDPNRLGAACGRACVAHLEDAHRLTRSFRNRFRGLSAVEG